MKTCKKCVKRTSIQYDGLCAECYIEKLEFERQNCVLDRLLEWRGIETPCKKCSGSGEYVYPNTSTWMGGIGGQAITSDVCDKCWGSGDANKPWANLRLYMDKLRNIETIINQCIDVLDEELGDTDPFIENCTTWEDVKEEEPLFWLHNRLVGLKSIVMGVGRKSNV